jgi:CRISPR-associated protein Cas2
VRILVAYDVNTSTPAGERRLRRVAQACVNFGQRVQKSVFECIVTEGQYESLRRSLLAEIDPQADSLRVYRLTEPMDATREVFGVAQEVDVQGPLIV